MKKLKKILPIMLAMLMIIGSTLTVSAAESEYDVSSFNTLKYTVIFDRVITSGSGVGYSYNYIISSDKPIYTDTTGTTFYIPEGATVITYTKSGAGFIADSSKYSGGSSLVSSKETAYESNFQLTIYCADYDIYDSEGNLVFLSPLPPVERSLVQMEAEIQKQTQVILIIAVACLALLTTSYLLSKKLRIFLPS